MNLYMKVQLEFAYKWASSIQQSLKSEYENSFEDFFKSNLVDLIPTMAKFSQFTMLHHYIEYEISRELEYYVDYFLDQHEYELCYEYLTNILNLYAEEYCDYCDEILELDENEDLETYNILFKRYNRLIYENLLEYLPLMTEDVFYVLFQDREFLLDFNLLVSQMVSEIKQVDNPMIMKKDGVLKRCPFIPKWLKDGVMFRDKGRCQGCYTSLTGTEIRGEKVHYDHIVPLDQGGINDPSNIQLLCEKCNLSKSGIMIYTSKKYPRFW